MGKVNEYLWDSAAAVIEGSGPFFAPLENARILVTGSTGLIASQLVRVLLAASDTFGLNLQLLLPVRNIAKAKGLFGERENVSYAQWQLGEDLPDFGPYDYLIHTACGTSSKAFLNEPATTIKTIIDGGIATLDSARAAQAKYVFLSTMEVYGEVEGDATEDNLGKLDTMVPRNSYPEAKKMIECLCSSYLKEYGLDTVVVRLAQTFGQGVAYGDMRVFADFGRHAVEGQGIVLLSDGMKHNAYLSVDDAVRAILVCMLHGKPGEAYNAANEETYCSIRDMATLVLENFGANGAEVKREFDPEREATFRKASDLRLKTDKLQALGWQPQDSLVDMYRKMIDCWKAAE